MSTSSQIHRRFLLGAFVNASLIWVMTATVIAGDQLVQELKVEPGKAYRLSFKAAPATTDDNARWVIHLRDAAGRLPYDGVLEGNWQQVSLGSHLFYAHDEASTLQLRVRGKATLENVRLEEWHGEDPVLNADFSEGEGNYSGWSERYLAELKEKDGRHALHIPLNGYALSDYFPVESGAKYAMGGQQGVAGVTAFAYDASRRLIAPVKRQGAQPVVMPENAAYARLFYKTGFNHLPTYRENEVRRAAFKQLEEGPKLELPKIVPCDRWEIILAAGADPREEEAARELRHWMAAITGKQPRLLAEPSESSKASQGAIGRLFIGRAWAGEYADDLKALEGTDGFAVRRKGDAIHLFSAHPRGALFGVHSLLERNSDIIFPRPHRDFLAFYTSVPELRFEEANFLSKPTFAHRIVSMSGHHHEPAVFHAWHARNGLNTASSLHLGYDYLSWRKGAPLGYSGAYTYWLSEVLNADERVQPLIDGKRDPSVWRQPCYTYPGTVEAIVQKMRTALESLPGREIEYLHATIADNWAVCSCPDCMAPIPLPEGGELKPKSTNSTKDSLFFSSRNFIMLNQVAQALVKDYPKLLISSHAYIFTAEPPVVPVHPAIMPEFAAYPTKNERYPIMAGNAARIAGQDEGIWKRRFEEWGRRKAGELGYFGYYYTEGYNALADTAAEDFRMLASYRALQAHTEGFPVDGDELSSWDADAIEKWVISRLMWDPSQDPEALRKQFITRVYKGAEKEMTEFYGLIREVWHKEPPSVFVNCHSEASRLFSELIIKPGIEEPARKLLIAAESKASDPRTRQVLKRQLAYFEKLAGTVGRVAVPHVEEATREWSESGSPHWLKAVVLKDFRKVDDWRTFEKAEATLQTSVAVMHDRKNLYFKFTGRDDNPSQLVRVNGDALFPKGDRYEIRLQTTRGREFYFAAGPDGNLFTYPMPIKGMTKAEQGGDYWSAIVGIPLDILGGPQDQKAVKVRLGRVYRDNGAAREESSHNGAGIFNQHPTFWLDFRLN